MKQYNESSVMKIATILNFFFALLGILTAALAKSTSVLFDGLYSFISTLFTLTSLKIVKLVTRADTKDFPFGFGSFEPFFIIIRTTVMLIMNTALLCTAVFSIMSGGNQVEVSFILIYSVISVGGCAFVTVMLRKISRQQHSALLAAEYRSWLNDTLLSLSVLIAFLIMMIMRKTTLAPYAVYVDPAVTIILVLFLIPTLVSQFIANIRELLVAAAPEEIQQELEKIVRSYVEKNDFKGFEIYSTKRGRNLYMVIYVFLKDDNTMVRKVDKIRKDMILTIKRYWKYSDIDIVFTANPDWIPLSVPGSGPRDSSG
ncbi:cation diffusion facilitator family transporter [Breznakiella homolactica]|uniref:Cation transporter n=1 Tax=Breznakiella homolactica TaxID=2798577 RepID=A0A7T8BA09_9SPIR|nr:cation transporter [Breznakiella homolactica]QQO08871.1 cation transporter [Breznakiella homolactica]